MTLIAQSRGRYRAEDLESPGAPEKFAEIIEGELAVMSPAGRKHNRIAYHFQKLFDAFCATRPELDFGGDNEGFLLQRDPDVLLSPDASLFRYRSEAKSVWLEFAPEIVVEVLSPSNHPAEIAYKRDRYFAAGAEQIWIADPETQSIEFFFRDGRRLLAQAHDIVQCEGFAAGIEIRLDDIFAVRS